MPRHQVRPAGGRVLVGRLVEGPDGQLDRLLPAQGLPVAELDGRAGVPAPRAGGLEVGLLVVAAGGVVAEDAADPPRPCRSRRRAGTTARPCMASGRFWRTIWASWLALPSRVSVVPSTFS